MHLHERLPAGSYADAAYAGLQDSAPRAGLLSLHARMEGVGPDAWEHPDLAQVFGPRHAVWLIPRDAVAAFTLGRLPRDPERRREVEAVADAALAGGPDPGRRLGAATGRFLVRWDARRTDLIPIDPPDVDPEDARRDLARRYLTWFGEGMRPRFARWAGIDEQEAAETLRHVGPVEPPPKRPVRGVRLLPQYDPYAYGKPLPPNPHREVPGVILVGGRIAGTWARQGRKVTLRPHSGVSVDRIEEEARLLAGPLGGPVSVTVSSS
jgi:hypothetical protein